MSEVAENGLPIEWFCIDPPVKWEPFNVCKLGQAPVQLAGVTHLLDWVGECHYPDVASFIEESRCHGCSRKIRRNFDFSKLTNQSKILFVHRKGYIEHHAKLAPLKKACFKNKAYKPAILSSKDFGLISRGIRVHEWEIGDVVHEQDKMCVGQYWYDLEPFDPVFSDSSNKFVKQFAEVEYIGNERPRNIEPAYSPALFMTLPIHRLEVVRDPERDTYCQDLRSSIARQTWLEVRLTDE